MASRKSRAAAKSTAPWTPATGQLWLLAAIAALYAGRPMLASEGAALLGDGQTWVMLWLLLASIILLGAVSKGRLAAPLTWIDAAVLALIVWHTIAALAAVRSGSPRPTVNMLWEWIGLAAGYFCVRQVAGGNRAARALVTVMVALAAGLSALGFYQYFIAQPAERAAYARDPEGTLLAAGQWAPPDSLQRHFFEERLESKEPLAGFALTNSFAGFLVPWLLMVLAVAVGGAAGSTQSPRRALGALAIAVLIAGCLLLTKSRSGYVAAAAGIALAVGLSPLSRRWLTVRRLAGMAVVLGILIAAAVAVRGLDVEVLTQAGKSLSYRFHYWRAAWAMICDHPWLGCGPGNFQDYYTEYKLPEAGEEVQDPHNFLAELWATAGTPAALAMLAVLAGLAWRVLRAARKPPAESVAEPELPTSRRLELPWAAGGGLAGLIVAYALGPLVGLPFTFDRVWLVAAAGGVACWLLRDWARAGTLRPEWLGIAALAQCVHHLAAGGIAFPGVVGSFWLLLGLAVNATATPDDLPAPESARRLAEPVGKKGRLVPIVGLVAVLVAAWCCYLTAYQPVMRCQTALARAAEAESRLAHVDLRARPEPGGPRGPDEPEQDLEQAVAADPLSSEACRWLADYELQRWLADGVQVRRRRFAAAADAFVHLRPLASVAWQQMGEWYMRIFAVTRAPADAQRAAGYYTKAVERYPSSAWLWADLAEAQLAAGDETSARRAAAEACRLDDLHPPGDKQIGPAQRKRIEKLSFNSQESAETKKTPERLVKLLAGNSLRRFDADTPQVLIFGSGPPTCSL